MHKAIPVKFCLFFLLLFAARSSAQFNQWTWMAGDNLTNQAGVYGTQGVGNAANKPSARYEGGGEWIDLQGNFWHFGGGGFASSRSDLWKYDPNTNIWTWMKGPTTPAVPGVYGTMGVANIANCPGGRAFASLTWVDLAGNFWLFGGSGYNNTSTSGRLSDLWKYDPITNMWTWMNGPMTVNTQGVYGTKGVASAANRPGGRDETDAAWVDAQGNFWIFGGYGYDGVGGFGCLNDLWKYDPITNQWTWVSGDNLANQVAVYGTKGIANAANKPDGRMQYASWKDNAGNFWIFGSRGGSAFTQHDDLWKYDPVTNMWTWMKGAAGAGNASGTYGTKCVDGPNNNPPALYENRCRWEDDCGNLWLWGGNSHNDLWRYSQTTGNWTWVSGSNLTGQAGVYGTKGVSNATNMPGARCGNLPFRRKNTNELWFFGGGLPGDFNDFWKYVPDKPVASFTFNPNNACAPIAVAFTNTSTPGCNEIKSSAWNFGDPGSGANNVSTLTNPNHTFNTPGSYTVKLVVTNCTGSKDSTTAIVTVTSCGFVVNATGSNICSGSCGSVTTTCLAGTSPYTYSWNTGATTSNINPCPTVTTIYTVVVTDANAATASATAQVTVSPPMTLGTNTVDVKCNGGFTGSATVSSITGGTSPYTYSWAGGFGTTGFATGLSAGNYSITITDSFGCTKTAGFVVNQPTALVLNPGSAAVLCNGGSTGSASVTASGGTTSYTYAWNNGQTNANATGLSAGTYTVTVTDANACTKSVTVSVTQPTAIITTTTVTASTCTLGGTATASSGGGTGVYSYLWSNGQTTQTATGLAIGNYTVTVSDANNCTQTATASIIGTSGPTAGISIANNLKCFNDNSGSTTVTATGGTGSYTYSWNNGQTNANATGLNAGSYTVTVTDNNGCTFTVSVALTEPAVLVATATGANACQNATANGNAVGGTVNYNYLWSNGQATQNATGLSTGVYTLTVTDANGCTATDTAVVNISPPPIIVFTVDDSAGCVALCVNFTCNTANIVAYTWDFGDGSTIVTGTINTQAHCYKQTGTFSVTLTVTDNKGCTATLTKNNMIFVYPNVVAAFNASPQPTTILNPIITFTDQSTGGPNTWSWTFFDDGATSALQNPKHAYKDSGCFNVELIANNQYNCPDTVSEQVCIQGDYELYAPNAFTPDGSGLNDVWNVKGIGIDPNNFKLWIFDRWGDLIYETSDLYKGWDGRANGGKDIAQQDVYVWKVATKDFQGGKHSYIGHINLVR